MTDSKAHSFWCACGVEELPTRAEDGSFWEEIRCPGCDRIWRKADLSFPAWENKQVDLRREGGGSNYRCLKDRYMTCAKRIWALFPNDPLPAACAAQSWIERLEALLDRNLLRPHKYKLHGIPCEACDGTGAVMKDLACTLCGGTGEIM